MENSTNKESLPEDFTNAYRQMIDNCYNPFSFNYINEGFRGIKVCEEWLDSFSNFKKDMYPSFLEAVSK